MLVVVAKFQAKAGMEQELEEILKSFVPQVQDEEDTLMYVLHRSRKDAGQFLFYEKYKDKEAFKLHGSTPYFQEFFTKIGSLVDGTPIIEMYEPLAAIDR